MMGIDKNELGNAAELWINNDCDAIGSNEIVEAVRNAVGSMTDNVDLRLKEAFLAGAEYARKSMAYESKKNHE